MSAFCCRGMRSVTIGLIVAVYIGALVYIAFICPHDLAPDEAHYWDWSRQLDWSYYSKGPLVAWLIRASCTLFGDNTFGVRFPAATSGALVLLAVLRLAFRIDASPKFGLFVIVVACTHPAFAVFSVLMTIDAPLFCCWAWAVVFLDRAIRSAGKRPMIDWLIAGVLVCVGTLAKYTMLLVPAIVILYLVSRIELRPLLRQRGPWLFLCVSSSGLIPIVEWNARHGWIGWKHVETQAGLADDDSGVHWLGPLVYLGTQFGLMLGFWFIAWVLSIVDIVRRRDDRLRLFVLFSGVTWLTFLCASVVTRVQANWPATAYLTGLVLAAAWVWHRQHRPGLVVAASLSVVSGMTVLTVVALPEFVRPWLAKCVAEPTLEKPTPVRQVDPTARLAGWRALASEVDRQRQILRESGEEPVLASMIWTVPGELAFYCDGHPTVYSFGSVLNDRFSQYDLWRPNPVFDAQVFLGRTFVYVGAELPADVRHAFESCELVARVVHEEHGIPLASWDVRICRGFRGFDKPNSGRRPRY